MMMIVVKCPSDCHTEKAELELCYLSACCCLLGLAWRYLHLQIFDCNKIRLDRAMLCNDKMLAVLDEFVHTCSHLHFLALLEWHFVYWNMGQLAIA